MFDGVLETRAHAMSPRALSGLPGAAALHLIFVSSLLAVALLTIEPIVPPDIPIWQLGGGGQPPLIIQLGVEGGGGRERKPEAQAAKPETPKPEAPKPEAFVQPPEVSAEPPAPPEAPAVPDRSEETGGPVSTEGTGPKGSPDGSPEGGPDGVRWGVPGGDPLGTGHGPGAGGRGEGSGFGEGSGEEILQVTGDVRAPVKIAGALPEYPEIARRAKIEGRVVLEAVIDTEGNVVDIHVLRGETLLEKAAIDAVHGWKYQPALQHGRPVKVYFTVIVEFHLH